jgi:hypothetical protein
MARLIFCALLLFVCNRVLFFCWPLQQDPIIHRFTQALFAADVALCCLHRRMAEEELNLFQLAAGAVTQSSAASLLMPHAA